jgi:hypothetical protein
MLETEPEPRLENREAPEESNIDLQIIPEHGLLSNGETKFHRCTDFHAVYSYLLRWQHC